jgi:nucleotide sugar dehydrogenase
MIGARIAIIGTGRIGLCLALNLERSGHAVLGVDGDVVRVRHISEKTLRTTEPGVEDALRAATNLGAEHDIRGLASFNPDFVFIAVDTPSTPDGGYDGSRVDSVIRDLSSLPAPRQPADLILVSTVLPGFCDSRAAAAAACGYSLTYSPAFVAQGRIMRDQVHPAQVLVGEADAHAGDRIVRLYATMHRSQPSIHRMSRLSAEIAKLATNSFLTMKIAFANAIGDLAARAGANADAVLGAIAAGPRVGSALMAYGFGYGGPCLPRDNRALNLFARQHGCELLQGDATDAMNVRHLTFQVEESLRQHPDGAPIHVRSVTYKPDTEMLEESQPLAFAIALARCGRRVVIHERPAVAAELRARFPGLFEYADEGRAEDAGSPAVSGREYGYRAAGKTV